MENKVILTIDEVMAIINIMNDMESMHGLLESEELLRDKLEISIGDDLKK